MPGGIRDLLEYRKEAVKIQSSQFFSKSTYRYEIDGESVEQRHYDGSIKIIWQTHRGRYIIYFDTESRFGCDYCFYYMAGSESYEWHGWVVNGKFKSFMQAEPVPDLVDVQNDILHFLHSIVIKKYQNYQS